MIEERLASLVEAINALTQAIQSKTVSAAPPAPAKPAEPAPPPAAEKPAKTKIAPPPKTDESLAELKTLLSEITPDQRKTIAKPWLLQKGDKMVKDLTPAEVQEFLGYMKSKLESAGDKEDEDFL